MSIENLKSTNVLYIRNSQALRNNMRAADSPGCGTILSSVKLRHGRHFEIMTSSQKSDSVSRRVHARDHAEMELELSS